MIQYIHRPVGAGYATLAFEVLPQSRWDRFWKKVNIRWAVAYCSPRDTYSPEEGERISAARLQFVYKRPRLRNRGFAGILRVKRIEGVSPGVVELHCLIWENIPEIWTRHIDIND